MSSSNCLFICAWASEGSRVAMSSWPVARDPSLCAADSAEAALPSVMISVAVIPASLWPEIARELVGTGIELRQVEGVALATVEVSGLEGGVGDTDVVCHRTVVGDVDGSALGYRDGGGRDGELAEGDSHGRRRSRPLTSPLPGLVAATTPTMIRAKIEVTTAKRASSG